jgi:hypothetical protein
MKITYRFLKNYKYQIVQPYTLDLSRWLAKEQLPVQTILWPESQDPYIVFTNEGILQIKHGYAWDGPSGPTIDTKSFMRGALVHDALYQLIREKCLPFSFRLYADSILREICLHDGMWKFRANYVHVFLRWFGAGAARPGKKDDQLKIETAP